MGARPLNPPYQWDFKRKCVSPDYEIQWKIKKPCRRVFESYHKRQYFLVGELWKPDFVKSNPLNRGFKPLQQ